MAESRLMGPQYPSCFVHLIEWSGCHDADLTGAGGAEPCICWSSEV